jgi:hypothetical protein
LAAIAPPPAPPESAMRRRLIALGVALFLIAIAAAPVLLTRDEDEPAPHPIQRADPILDLLGWIPATDETRRTFAAWSEDPGGADGTPVAISAADSFFGRLAMTPLPFTLGRSRDWHSRFGYSAREVTGWATAGNGASIAVLIGEFDRGLIEETLRAAGYRETSYQGVALYVLHDVATPSRTVDGDAVSAANAVAFFADRLITGVSTEAVWGAIDAARGRIPSLADEAAVEEIVGTLAPISGLVAIDAADHAVDCGRGGLWTRHNIDRPSGRYVVVGYGRLGDGGERRTMVATSFGDWLAASGMLDTYTVGWQSGTVSAAGAGADVSAYGRVSAVGQTDKWLVAELLDGREDGWVRAGIRFASPVCQAVETALPPGKPVPPPSADGARESPEGAGT